MNRPAVFDVPMRWGDMDAQGHVNNVLYVDYLEEARCQLFNEGPGYLLDEGVIVVGHEVEYLRPIEFSGEPMHVALAVSRVGAARIDLSYELSHNSEVCARATTVLCPFDFDDAVPRRLTADERAWFESRRAPMPPLREVRAPKLVGRGVGVPVYTRWSDCDRYGHINNVRYYDYVQESRITVTQQLLPERAERTQEALEVDPTDHIWLVARQDMDYVNQMPYRPEPFLATVAPVHLGTSSIVVATEITDPLADGRVMARARTVVVCADEHAVPTPVPAAIRATIEPNLVS